MTIITGLQTWVCDLANTETIRPGAYHIVSVEGLQTKGRYGVRRWRAPPLMTDFENTVSVSAMIRRWLMRITDIGMLGYWGVTGLMALSVITIPGDWLFRDYHDAQVIAWNWSFFPLDLLFSVTGLWALHLESRGDARWRGWAIISLTLTFCAGLMAISYWALLGDFDFFWWAPNLFLIAWPLPYLYKMTR